MSRAGRRPADELGAHMSIAGGLHRALERGAALACGAVQIFLKNQRQWAAPAQTDEMVRAFLATRRRTGIRAVFAHASYLINLAAPDPAAWQQAVAALTDEVERAEALRLRCVIVHPGSHMGAGAEAGVARVAAAVDEVLTRTRGARVKVALENTAGAGHGLGRSFIELARVVERVREPGRLGICVDTCHLFAAGYDIRTRTGWDHALDECRAAVGLSAVLAFHLNDAAAPLGSGLDRHANIGEGALGLGPFRWLLNDPALVGIPKVLETPKEPEPSADRANLARLRRLRRVSASSSRPPAGTRR